MQFKQGVFAVILLILSTLASQAFEASSILQIELSLKMP